MNESPPLLDANHDHTPNGEEAQPAAETERQRPLLRAAVRCEVGALRDRNEDSCLALTLETGGHFPLQPVGLYVVADGMGGHENGHMASRAATRAVAHSVLQDWLLPCLSQEQAPDPGLIQAQLEAAVLTAHDAVYDPDPLHDAGTTLTLALVVGPQLFLAHVGDSRAYWLVDDKLELLTNDHSLVQRLQEVGQLTPEEAQNYQYRNILLRALGQEEALEVDTQVHDLPSRGKLLLCSDGLCGLVDHEEMQRIAAQPADPQRITDLLYASAMAAGGYDNITALVVEFAF